MFVRRAVRLKEPDIDCWVTSTTVTCPKLQKSLIANGRNTRDVATPEARGLTIRTIRTSVNPSGPSCVSRTCSKGRGILVWRRGGNLNLCKKCSSSIPEQCAKNAFCFGTRDSIPDLSRSAGSLCKNALAQSLKATPSKEEIVGAEVSVRLNRENRGPENCEGFLSS
jgi:hypothetical protein